MNIRTHIQALLICTMALSAQAQSIVDSRASLPRAVQLHGDEGRETVRPDESKRISPNEAPASRMQPQRIVNRIAATVNGRPITANEVSVRLMPIGAQLAAQYPKQGPEFYKQLALAKKNIIEDLVERELLRNEFEGMGGVIRDSLIDQEINRTILTTFNGDRSAFLKNLNLSGMTIRAFREMTKKQLQVQIMRASKYDQEIPPTPEEIRQEYEATKEQYRDLTKDKIKFKKIFIPMLGDDSASTPEVQLNLAELIAKEIKSKTPPLKTWPSGTPKTSMRKKAAIGPSRSAPRSPRNPPPSSLARSPAKSSGRWWTPPASPSCWWKKRNWPLLRHFPPSRSRST